jgi:hypothetical protein
MLRDPVVSKKGTGTLSSMANLEYGSVPAVKKNRKAVPVRSDTMVSLTECTGIFILCTCIINQHVALCSSL